jgi:hypothetical protein
MAALILQDKPGWSPEEIKALIMNTAFPLADDTPVSRSGSGRVDAWQAVESDFVATGDDYLASINWGVVVSRQDIVETDSQLTIFNRSATAKTFDLAYAAHPESETAGINLAFPSWASVAGSGSQSVSVTLCLDMTQTSADFYYQLICFDSGTRVWPIGSFDYQKSPFDWRIDNLNPGPGNNSTIAWVGIEDRQGYDLCKPKGTILVDYRGNPSGIQGAQAYFLDVIGRPKSLPGIFLLLLE